MLNFIPLIIATLSLSLGPISESVSSFANEGLRQDSNEVIGNEYFTDGDFSEEDHSLYWDFSNASNYSIGTEGAMEGNCLKWFSSTNQYVQCKALILPNNYVYAFSYYINVTEAIGLQFSTYFTGANVGWIDFSSDIITTTTGQYRYIKSLLTVNGNIGQTSEVYIGFKSYVGQGTVYIDNCSLKGALVNPGPNLDFESQYDGMPVNWAYAGDGEFVAQDKVLPPNTKGKLAAKITNVQQREDASYIRSQMIPVIGGHTYETSYWCKVEGDYSADSYMMFVPYKSDGTAAPSYVFDPSKPNDYYRSKEGQGKDFLNPVWQYHIYGESDWRKVSFSFEVPSEAVNIEIRIIVLGNKTASYVDDIVIKEAATYDEVGTINNYDDNPDFERLDEDGKPSNWHMSSSRSYSSLITSDSSHYYNGKHSLYINNTPTLEKVLVENPAKKIVTPGDIYEFSAYVSSANCDPTVKIKLNLIFFDDKGCFYNEFGDKLYMYGETKVLSCSSARSEWTQLYTRTAIPNQAKYVSYYFEISSGHSEIWIDNIQIVKVEAADEPEKLEFHTDFDKLDSNGVIDGFILNDPNSATFTLGKEMAQLYVQSGDNVKIYRKLTNFLTGYQYHLLFNYESLGSGYIRIDFYNAYGVQIEGTSQERSFDNKSDPINFYFDSPSNTYAVISIGLNGAGILNLNYLYIYQSRTPASRGEWTGKWVWYNEDATKNIEQYRYFRYTFELDDTTSYAPLQITVDDKFVLYVNGIFIDFNWSEGADSWANVHTYFLQDYLLKGKNVIAIKAYNLVSEAGVLFDGIFTLNNGSQFTCASSQQVVSHLPSPDLGDVDVGSTDVPLWATPNFDDTTWEHVKEIGAPPTAPWGPVFYDASLYAAYSVDLNGVSCQRKIEAGQTLEYSLTLQIYEKFDANVSFTVGLVPSGTDSDTKSVQKVACKIISENSDMREWEVGKDINVTLSMRISSLIDPGRYDLRLESSVMSFANEYIGEERIIDNRFAAIKVLESSEPQTDLVAKVENYNGAPTLMINDQPYSPSLYLRPDLNVYRQTDAEDRISNSTYQLFITYQGCLGKSGQDILYREDGSLDYEAFDQAIISLLNVMMDGYVMVNFGMFAPRWWMDAHPSEVSYAMDTNGNKIKGEGVSFSSKLWLETSNQLLGQLIDHMKEQKYYNRIFGLRITAGQTYEFMNYDASGARLPDYSDCAKIGFVEHLKEKYQTNEALQKAWNDPDITFDTANIPTFNERGETEYSTLLDITQDKRIYDYNIYLATKSADCLLTWAKTCKDKTENKKIVGAYYGYMWAFGSYDGAPSSHSALSRVLSSEYIDFVASPINYNERILGLSTTFMSMLDTVQAYGKLYLLEQDNRTVMSSAYSGQSWDGSWDYQVGTSHTMQETIYQFKRDFCHNFVDGSGYWNYDMYGGWLDDDQIYQTMSLTKSIYDFSFKMEERSFVNDVAVFVSDNYYSYLSVDDTYNSPYIVNSTLFASQREFLNRMGTGYDTYTMSSLRAGLVPEHKVNIFLSTFEVDAELMMKTKEYLSKSGGYAVWIYGCGYSDGTIESNAETNMKALTGFDIGLDEGSHSLQVETITSNNSLLAGCDHLRYGTCNSFVSPQFYIKDSDDCEVLGYLNDSGMRGLGVKDLGAYKSIYSAGTALPTKLLRNILKEANVHIYSDNANDIVYSNNNYVALHSAIGEEKVIHLKEHYAVYDEFAQQYISLDTDTITYNHEAGDTKLFRLDPVGGLPPEPVPEPVQRYSKKEFIITTCVIVAGVTLIITLNFVIKGIIKRRKRTL